MKMRFKYFYLEIGQPGTEGETQERAAERGVNWGVLRVYDGDSDRMLCTAVSFVALLKVLRALGLKGSVRVVTARCVEDLPIPSREREIERIEQTIKAFRTRGDRYALRRLSRAVRGTGVKRGPKRTGQYNRDRIEELRKRKEAVPYKQIAPPYRADIGAHTASVRVGRFCRSVAQLFVLRGAPDVSSGWDPQLAEAFAKKLDFKIPEELPLVRYALEYCRILQKPTLRPLPRSQVTNSCAISC
jgi:hypothetical protein